MRYEVIRQKARGNEVIVGMWTESPACIDSIELQKEPPRSQSAK